MGASPTVGLLSADKAREAEKRLVDQVSTDRVFALRPAAGSVASSMAATAGGSLDEYQSRTLVRPEQYEPFVGAERIDELKRLAEPLTGKGWANINSTFSGGGVAELLRSAVPLARGLGIDARWYGLRGTDEFFRVTKKFHNLLQGEEQSITLEEMFGVYLETIEENARRAHIVSDVIEVHDPQPAALIMSGALYGHVLWRCHIDTSTPDPLIWRFLLPYVNQCAGAIFSMPEFVGAGLKVPLYQVTPCIDPLAAKNREFTEEEALDVLAPLFQETNVDPGRPILAAVSRYDNHKNQRAILRAFELLKANFNGVTPYLIFLGNTAADDPEGGNVLDCLRREADADPDVRFWADVEDNDRVVGALMRVARACIHVLTREGHGLVVSEALWQGTPVIGSRVGGIKAQVLDGETGYLVDSLDVEAIAAAMRRLVEEEAEARAVGAQGKEHVRGNFLLPELMKRYLVLLRLYTGVDESVPEFRLDNLSYSEVLQAVMTLARGRERRYA